MTAVSRKAERGRRRRSLLFRLFEINALGLGIIGSLALFFALDEEVDLLRLGLGLLLGRWLFEGAEPEKGEFAAVNGEEEQNEEGKAPSETLQGGGEERHAAMIARLRCRFLPQTGIFSLFWEKLTCMEETEKTLTAAEAAEFGEFRRMRRETEISFTLHRLLVDASRRETDAAALKRACETAVRLKASGVLVSPVNVAAARKLLTKSDVKICCLVGGTGESLISVKKTEAKLALRRGAGELRLVLCYSRLTGGGLGYLKREIRRVRRAARRAALTVSLEDHSLGADAVSLGIKAAIAGRADGVCVRGETDLVLLAAGEGAPRIQVEASGVENAEQLRMLVKAGATRATTPAPEEIARELYEALGDGSVL